MLVPHMAFGQMVITEIMYDLEGTDTGREWIEIKNTGGESVDISDWKLFEANVNHKLVPVGSGVIPPGGFGIIVDSLEKWKIDYPRFNGLVFDSAFSLGNSGETLILRDGNGVDVDSVSYTADMGAQGDGYSLQKTSQGIFVGAVVTLGSDTTVSQGTVRENTETDNETTEERSVSQIKNTDTSSTHSSQTIANTSFDAPELIVTSGRSRIGFVGTPMHFEAKIQKMKEIPAGNGASHVWSMGDGSSKSGQFISHVYQYSGDYIVILNSSMGGADAVSKVSVKIIEPKVAITESSPEYVEITNNDTYEINIGGWVIETGTSRATIPQDTIVSPRNKIRLPIAYLNLRNLGNELRLKNPLGKEVSLSSIASLSIHPDELTILLPDGMTEESFRQKIARALETTQYNSLAQIKPVSQVFADNTPATTSPYNVESDNTLAEVKTATSTQTASVLYSLTDAEIETVWQKVKKIFKR